MPLEARYELALGRHRLISSALIPLNLQSSETPVMDSQTPSSTTTATSTPPELKLSIHTPAAVSALAFGKGNYLAVGAGEV